MLGIMPENPKLYFSKVKDKVKELSDKHMLADLTSKEDSHSKKVRQIVGLGLIEGLSLKKGTGCSSLADFVNWIIDNLAYNVSFNWNQFSIPKTLDHLASLLQTMVISWERTSTFLSALLLIYKYEGFDIEDKIKNSRFSIG